MLTPARNANSRWRGSRGYERQHRLTVLAHRPGAGKIVRGDDDRRHAVAGARRPARRLVLVRGRQRLDPELAGAEAAGKVLQQIEGLGQHVVARHRLELGNVERGENGAQAPACPGRGCRRRPREAPRPRRGCRTAPCRLASYRHRYVRGPRASVSVRSARSANRSAGKRPVRRARDRGRRARPLRARYAGRGTR